MVLALIRKKERKEIHDDISYCNEVHNKMEENIIFNLCYLCECVTSLNAFKIMYIAGRDINIINYVIKTFIKNTLQF